MQDSIYCSKALHQQLVEVPLQLLARIDGGAAFAIDQIPVKDLQHLLASLFENLLLKKTNQAGAHSSGNCQPSSQLKRTEILLPDFRTCFTLVSLAYHAMSCRGCIPSHHMWDLCYCF